MAASPPLGLFRGEVALVTGSASNIGRAIARALAWEGAAVHCVDVDWERNRSLVADIVAAGGRAEAVTADLASPDGWRAALRAPGVAISLFVHSASPPRREADGALAVD